MSSKRNKREVGKQNISDSEIKGKNKLKTAEKRVICYYCGGTIHYKRDLVKVPVTLVSKGKKKDVDRICHLDCVKPFMDKIEVENEKLFETSEWDKCYDAFKNVAGTPNKALPQYAVNRLLGLRVGRFTPKGMNVKNIKQGYTYEEIRLTILYCSSAIRKALATESFKDDKHRINYVMTIITSNIDTIARRMEKVKVDGKAAEKSVEQLENYQQIGEIEYKSVGGGSFVNKDVLNELATDYEEEGYEILDELF